MPNIINSLNKSINVQSRHSVKQGKFNKTRTAIIKKRGTSPHKYDISIDGTEYKDVPVYGACTFSKGNSCKVTIPNNEMSQMFIVGDFSYQNGDVIFNVNNNNPSNIFGGNWKLLGTLTVGNNNTVYCWQKIQ